MYSVQLLNLLYKQSTYSQFLIPWFSAAAKQNCSCENENRVCRLIVPNWPQGDCVLVALRATILHDVKISNQWLLAATPMWRQSRSFGGTLTTTTPTPSVRFRSRRRTLLDDLTELLYRSQTASVTMCLLLIRVPKYVMHYCDMTPCFVPVL